MGDTGGVGIRFGEFIERKQRSRMRFRQRLDGIAGIPPALHKTVWTNIAATPDANCDAQARGFTVGRAPVQMETSAMHVSEAQQGAGKR
jgi:hypothetical protein